MIWSFDSIYTRIFSRLVHSLIVYSSPATKWLVLWQLSQTTAVVTSTTWLSASLLRLRQSQPPGCCPSAGGPQPAALHCQDVWRYWEDRGCRGKSCTRQVGHINKSHCYWLRYNIVQHYWNGSFFGWPADTTSLSSSWVLPSPACLVTPHLRRWRSSRSWRTGGMSWTLVTCSYLQSQQSTSLQGCSAGGSRLLNLNYKNLLLQIITTFW